MELKNRSFLKLLDYTPAEIGQLLELAADLKAKKKAGSLKRPPPAPAVALRWPPTIWAWK